MTALAGRTARGGAVTIVSHGFKLGISIIATAVLARLLTPGDYGLVGMVAVVTSFASLFKDMGLSLATVQKSEINDRQLSTLFWVNVALSVLVALVIVIAAPWVARFYGESKLTSITMVTAAGFPLGGLAVQHEALLKRQMRFFALSAIAFVSVVAGYVIGISLAWYGAGYWALVFGQLGVLAVGAMGVWLVCRWRPGLPRRDSGVLSMLAFGRNVTGYSTINYLAGNVDTLLIGRFCGPQQLGFYSKASQLIGLPTNQISEPIAAVTIPALSRLNDSPERYRQAYLRVMQSILMVTMPCIAFMIGTADWLVQLILGPQWSATTPIFVWMGLAALLQPINTTGWLLVTQGRSQHMLYWSVMSAPLTILLIVVGLWWGPIGVAASYAIGRMCILYPLMYWFVGRIGPVRTRDFYRLLAPFVCASTCALLACLAFRAFASSVIPLTGCVVSLGITVATDLLALSVLPAGRSALWDIKRSMSLLVAVESPAQARD
jgi:O-antigen/teichoic acid export membrane protein